MYLIYCGDRGWWGQGTYTNTVADAKRFDREAALTFCRRRFNPKLENELIAVPVLLADVEAIIK